MQAVIEYPIANHSAGLLEHLAKWIELLHKKAESLKHAIYNCGYMVCVTRSGPHAIYSPGPCEQLAAIAKRCVLHDDKLVLVQ